MAIKAELPIQIDDIIPNPILNRYAAGTVIEHMASINQSTVVDRAPMPQPPPTGPQPMQTHTRSGAGQALMTDDSQTDHLYE